MADKSQQRGGEERREPQGRDKPGNVKAELLGGGRKEGVSCQDWEAWS